MTDHQPNPITPLLRGDDMRGVHLSISGTDDAPLWCVLISSYGGYAKACCDGHKRVEDAIDHGVNTIRWALADSLTTLPSDSYGAQVLSTAS